MNNVNAIDTLAEERATEHSSAYRKSRTVYRYQLAIQAIPAHATKVVDIACGSGIGTSMLAMHFSATTGIDVSQDAIDRAASHFADQPIEWRVGTAISLPFENASLDALVSCETIEHLSESDQVVFLDEAVRTLRPDGVAFLTTPNALFRLPTDPPNPYHLKELSPTELHDLLVSKFADVKLLGLGRRSRWARLKRRVEGLDRWGLLAYVWKRIRPRRASHSGAQCGFPSLDTATAQVVECSPRAPYCDTLCAVCREPKRS